LCDKPKKLSNKLKNQPIYYKAVDKSEKTSSFSRKPNNFLFFSQILKIKFYIKIYHFSVFKKIGGIE
jgi:hypothetical protein